MLKPKGTIEFWFKPSWDGGDGEDSRIFDASMDGIYFFISKGAGHGDINSAEFEFYFEDKVDKDWQQLEFDPKGEVKKNGWFHIAATWEFTTKGKSSQEACLYFSGEEIAKGNGLGEFPVLHVNPRFGLEVIKYVPSKNGAQGLIDNIAIYSKALTEKEVKRDMGISPSVDIKEKLALTWGGIKSE